jgi:hypothetical protein
MPKDSKKKVILAMSNQNTTLPEEKLNLPMKFSRKRR